MWDVEYQPLTYEVAVSFHPLMFFFLSHSWVTYDREFYVKYRHLKKVSFLCRVQTLKK